MEFVLHVPTEYDYRYASDQRENIIKTISERYAIITGKNLPLYGVPHLYLKDFVTSKSDIKKNFIRIPEEGFRIREQDKTYEESKDNILWNLPNLQRTKSHSLYQKNKAEREVMLKDFKTIKIIGKGNYGTVYLVEMISTGNTYAMKELRKDVLIDTDQIENTRIEKEIMKNANHPFLISLDYVFQTPGKIFFVMKLMRGGELFSLMSKERRFTESRARFYTAQIVLALTHLHKNNIIYRDIKGENILVDEDGYLCLADFGLARFLEEDKRATSFCGTPEYMAPEVVLSKGHNKAVDWWGIGILLYEMLVGISPFHHDNQMTMYQYITFRDVIFPDPVKHKITVSPTAKDLILKVLSFLIT
jgi:tRNA A-37 threonylcarbamoyl transferase component Bud32